MPEDRRAEVEQPRPTTGDADAAAAERQPVQMPAGTPVAANAALATAAAVAIRQDAAEQRAASVRAQKQQARDAAVAAVNEDVGVAEATRRTGSEGSGGAANGSGTAAAGAASAGADAASDGGGDDANGTNLEPEKYVHIPEDERQQLANDFLELMQVCCGVSME